MNEEQRNKLYDEAIGLMHRAQDILTNLEMSHREQERLNDVLTEDLTEDLNTPSTNGDW